jgi:5,10-methylenetetrahydromethanopterin reductase
MTHPAEIATHAATLDLLTGSRALLGIGLHGASMLSWLGYDASDVVARTRETVVIVKALLAGETPAEELVHFTWSDEWRLRFPLARAAIPIYVTPYGRELDELAGELGDGSLPMLFPPALAAPVVARTLAAATRAGRATSAIDVAGCVWLSVAEDRRSAEDLLRPMIVHYGSYMTDEALAAIGLGRGDFAAIERHKAGGDEGAAAALVTGDMLRLGIAGAPADVAAQIEEVAAAGVTQMNLGGPLGPDPAAAIALMGASVIPHFR